MKTLTLIEWRLLRWHEKGYMDGMRTYIVVNGKRIEVEVIDEDGKRISHQ